MPYGAGGSFKNKPGKTYEVTQRLRAFNRAEQKNPAGPGEGHKVGKANKGYGKAYTGGKKSTSVGHTYRNNYSK